MTEETVGHILDRVLEATGPRLTLCIPWLPLLAVERIRTVRTVRNQTSREFSRRLDIVYPVTGRAA
jgi:hypothetical protein